MQYDFYNWQSIPLSFMHLVNWVKPPPGFESRSPDWEADDLPTELSLLPNIMLFYIVITLFIFQIYK